MWKEFLIDNNINGNRVYLVLYTQEYVIGKRVFKPLIKYELWENHIP